MPKLNRTLPALVLFTAMALLAGAVFAAQPKVSGKTEKNLQVTGQHRGYTNDSLFLRLDDGKEMTFTVQIPGDTKWAWHDHFKTLSRITVTYHEAPDKKQFIATAIEQAKDAAQK